jgi:microcystin degradation protein MlrC
MKKKRIAIAQVKQETNTFTPVPCTLEDFKQVGLYHESDFLDKFRKVAEIGGFLDALQEYGMEAEVVPLLRALGHAGGRVEKKAAEFFKERLVEGLRKAMPLDGMFFSLHGAAAAEHTDDLEGYLLEAVRSIVGPDLPLVVTLDHHANITEKMVALSDIMVGYETQPHLPYYTAKKAADLFFRLLREEYSPVAAWQKIPMLVGHHERLDTAEGEPMKEWFDRARKLETRDGVLTISNFPMQPWMDIEEAGFTTVVYTDGQLELARELAEDLADLAWSLRERFWESNRMGPDDAVRYAEAAPEGPVLLSDPADTVFGGAPGDSTCILQEMLKQNIKGKALVPIYDPEVYRAAKAAGKGAEITVEVGGKSKTPYSKPVKVTGLVTGISEGFTVDPREGGKFDPGPLSSVVQRGTVVLEVGNIVLLVSEGRLMSGIHPGIYRYFGIEPADAQMIVMKTGGNFQHYDGVRKEVVYVDCPGVAQADLTRFDWVRAPRPLYPMDKETMKSWKAHPMSKGADTR